MVVIHWNRIVTKSRALALVVLVLSAVLAVETWQIIWWSKVYHHDGMPFDKLNAKYPTHGWLTVKRWSDPENLTVSHTEIVRVDYSPKGR